MDRYIIISIIISITVLFAYIFKLFFMSKCKKADLCCFHIERETSEESQNVSNIKIPINI